MSDSATGAVARLRATGGETDTIMEAFKPGTGPADSYWVIGMDEMGAGEGGEAISPEANRAISQGAGGLY